MDAQLYQTLFDEAPVAMLLEDWSGVKRMVDALVASGIEDLEAYLRCHPEFFQEARKTHVFLDANQATVALFGAPGKAEFLAMAPQLLPGSPESNIHVVLAMARGQTHAQGERLLRTIDGRQVAILWQVTLAPDRFDRLLFMATNVDALKAAEEALINAQAELSHAARVAMLGELTASITHEVNQPLGAIRIFADTALRWIDRPEPNVERARSSIERISSSAAQASDVILRMREFARKAPPRKQPLNVSEVLTDTILLIEREAARHQVELTVELAPDLPRVAGDRVQVQQVLTNLTMNAIHALSRRPGGERRVVIRVTAETSDAVAFSVADTGPGIDAGHLPRIFEPFFSTREDGLGLGLAICRSIVEAHGGDIVARAGDSGGAVFSFRLPAFEASGTSG